MTWEVGEVGEGAHGIVVGVFLVGQLVACLFYK